MMEIITKFYTGIEQLLSEEVTPDDRQQMDAVMLLLKKTLKPTEYEYYIKVYEKVK